MHVVSIDRPEPFMTIVQSRRAPFFLIAGVCAALLGFGYYLQFQQGQAPCPLCIFQRVCFMGVGVLGLLAGLHGPRFRAATLYASLIFLVATAGTGIAGRQVWLQHLPADQVPECGPGLDFLMEMYPLAETIGTVLRGSGDCAKVDWTFLGLSIAEWSLLCFIGLCVMALAILYYRFQQHVNRHRRRSSRREELI
jgi:disulfide bond formation protein DsbB